MHRALGVALGDVDALDANRLHERRPAGAVLRLLDGEAEVAGDVHERGLDQPGHHARVRAAAGDGRGAARIGAALDAHALAQHVVGARGRIGGAVEVEALPGLHDRVDVERPELAAELHQVERGGVDGKVDAEALAAAGRQQRRQQLAVVGLGHAVLDEADPAFVDERPVGVDRIDHHHACSIEFKVPLDERKSAAADGSETDQDDGTGDLAVHGP